MTGPYVHGYDPRETQRLQDQASTLVGAPAFGHALPGRQHGPRGRLRCRRANRRPGSQQPAGPDHLDRRLRGFARRGQESTAGGGISNVTLRQADIFRLPFPPESSTMSSCASSSSTWLDPWGAASLETRGEGRRNHHGDRRRSWLDLFPSGQRVRAPGRSLPGGLAGAGGGQCVDRTDPLSLLTEAGFADIRVSPRLVYADASKPELVEGFTKNTFTAMIEGIRTPALGSRLMSESDFDRGVADLYRTAEPDGVFCYTFFKATAVKGRRGEVPAPRRKRVPDGRGSRSRIPPSRVWRDARPTGPSMTSPTCSPRGSSSWST